MGWVYLSDRAKLISTEKVQETMRLADSDIRDSLAANPGIKHALGLSFIVPYWKSGYCAEKSLEKIYDELDGIDCSFYAICKNTSDDIVSTKGNVCNLAILIGKFLRD